MFFDTFDMFLDNFEMLFYMIDICYDIFDMYEKTDTHSDMTDMLPDMIHGFSDTFDTTDTLNHGPLSADRAHRPPLPGYQCAQGQRRGTQGSSSLPQAQ